MSGIRFGSLKQLRKAVAATAAVGAFALLAVPAASADVSIDSSGPLDHIYLNSDLSTESGVSETITKLTQQGKLGIKAGGGLFEYSQDELAELPAKRAAALVAVRKTLDAQDV